MLIKFFSDWSRSNVAIVLISHGWNWLHGENYYLTAAYEPLLRDHLSYKATFSLSQGSWPLNTGLTVFYLCTLNIRKDLHGDSNMQLFWKQHVITKSGLNKTLYWEEFEDIKMLIRSRYIKKNVAMEITPIYSPHHHLKISENISLQRSMIHE
jgi:hypothetical protein